VAGLVLTCTRLEAVRVHVGILRFLALQLNGLCNVSGRKTCWEKPTMCFGSGGHVVGRIKHVKLNLEA